MLLGCIAADARSLKQTSAGYRQWEDFGPSMSCMDNDGENLAIFRYVRSLDACKDLCQDHTSSPCNAVTYSTNQNCYLKQSCNNLQNRQNGDISSILVNSPDPPCPPPVRVICKPGSMSSKCVEYCGHQIGGKQQPQQACGGVEYICQ